MRTTNSTKSLIDGKGILFLRIQDKVFTRRSYYYIYDLETHLLLSESIIRVLAPE